MVPNMVQQAFPVKGRGAIHFLVPGAQIPVQG